MRTPSSLFALSLAILAVQIPSSGTCPELLGRVPDGPSRAVVSAPGLAFFGNGSLLSVMDTSNPGSASILAKLETGGIVSDLFLDGNRLYAAAGYGGLVIVDISDPASPSILGTWMEGSNALGVAAASGRAYLADGSTSSFRVLDVGDPAQPALLGGIPMAGISKLAVFGDYAYVAASASGLRVLSVGDPANPAEVGFADVGGAVMDVAVHGNTAYLAKYAGGLSILDVSDPANPTEIGTCEAGDALGIAVEGDRAYVASNYPTVAVVDVTDPANPALLGSYHSPRGLGRDVSVVAGTVCLAYGFGVDLLDLAAPAAPQVLCSYPTLDETSSVMLRGGLAFVGTTTSGLRIFDASDPTHPSLLGSLGTDSVRDVDVVGNVAYIGDYSQFRTVDVSDPTRPQQLGSLFELARIEGLEVRGDRVYLGDGPTLRILDVSDPASPAQVGSVDVGGSIRDVKVDGNLAVLAAYGAGLFTVDVTDPAHPATRGHYDTRGYSRGVATVGSLAYLADTGALLVFDLADPGEPNLLTSVSTRATDVVVDRRRAYVADYRGGLTAYDIADPANPLPLGSESAPGTAVAVALDGGLAAVAQGEGGFALYGLGGCIGPGDCDGDGEVSIGEVQKAVNMFLGLEPPACGADCNGDGSVSIGEVQKVINAFLGLAVGC